MLNSRNHLIVGAVLITLMILPGSMAQVLEREVCGKVTFKNGSEAPAHVEVLLDFSYENIIPGAVVNGDGTFCVLNAVSDLNTSTPARLYVMSFCGQDDKTLVDAPFWLHLRKYPRFAGKRVEVGHGSRPEIGEADVQFAYGHVSLTILARGGRPLLTDADDWRSIRFRVRDQYGVTVDDSGLSRDDIKRTVNLKDSRINLALPQGIWSLEVFLGEPPSTEDSSVGWLKVGRKLKIGTCGESLNLTVRVPRTTKA